MASNSKHLYKWVVIGIIAIAFFIIFKEDVSKILNRTKKVSISTSGITLETPIGFTQVTSTISHTNDYQSFYNANNFTIHVDNNFKYAISYPRNSQWKEDLEFGDEFMSTMSQVTGYSKGIYVAGQNDFIIGIVVRVYWAGNLSIEQAVLGFDFVAAQGAEYAPHKIDYSTNSAAIYARDSEFNVTHIGRALLRDGYLYDVRAMVTDEATDVLLDQANSIMNSFQFLY